MHNFHTENPLNPLTDPFESSNIVIYFAPHWENFPDPIRSGNFRNVLGKCDVFLLEYAEQWVTQESELERRYNQLARGEIPRLRQGMLAQADYLLRPYTDALQERIRGCNKTIMLERPTGPYIDTGEKQIVQLSRSMQLDEAISIHKNRQRLLADSMVQRDNGLKEVIEQQVQDEKHLFVLRGAAHERYLTTLFRGEPTVPRVLRFELPPPSVRLISALTMNEKVDDLAFLRHIYALVQCGSDYPRYLELQKQAESMNNNELRSSLSKWASG